MSLDRNYKPDSIYVNCLQTVNDCNNVCNNTIFSYVTESNVFTPERVHRFCAFGNVNTQNLTTFEDQAFLIQQEPSRFNKKWGRIPQLGPRPLSRIGLEWRN